MSLRSFLMPAVLLPALFFSISGCSKTEDYPSRPITLTCPWAAGGGTDRVSRQIAMYLEQELNVPVNVINATGGQGVTGHARGLQARPDGYTLAMVTLELNMLHWRGLTDLTWQDCEPLMSVNEDAAALFVKADSPLKNVQDLQNAVRENPGQLKASGTAALAAWHLALAGWLLTFDQQPDDIVWIPSRGSAPSLQELMSGGVDLVCCSVPEARTLLDSGEIRCLGIMADERAAMPGMEDYPTLSEQGSPWTLAGWRGLVLPTGTPEPIKEKLVTALTRIVTGETKVEGQTFPDYMDGEGFDRTWRATDDFAAFLEKSDNTFGDLLQRDEFQQVQSGPVGPHVFPALAGGLGVISLLVMFSGSFRTSADLDSAASTAEPAEGTPSLRDRLVFVMVPVAAAGYALFADHAGFIPVAAVILLVFALLLRSSLKAAMPLAIVGSVVIYQLFTGLLRVPLPPGWLGW